MPGLELEPRCHVSQLDAGQGWGESSFALGLARRIHEVTSAQGAVLSMESQNGSPGIREGTAEVAIGFTLGECLGVNRVEMFQAEGSPKSRPAPATHR